MKGKFPPWVQVEAVCLHSPLRGRHSPTCRPLFDLHIYNEVYEDRADCWHSLLKCKSICSDLPDPMSWSMFVCSVAYTQERKHRRQIPLNLYELINEARDMRVNPINEATMAPAWPTGPILEHSNSRFESIRFDSLCESIRTDSFCKKNRPFDSLVVMQLFLLI